MPACVALLLAVVLAVPQAPEWPDPGSEEPETPKLFPRDPGEEIDDSPKLEAEAAQVVGEPIYRWSWYGWRVIIGDAAALVLGLAAFATGVARQPGALEVTIATTVVYGVGGPIAHFTMGNWGRALISAGMRIAAPLALFGLSFGLCSIADTCDDALFAVGLATVGGAWIAAGLDIGLVARRQVAVEPKVALSPVINVAPGGAKTVGLAVQF